MFLQTPWNESREASSRLLGQEMFRIFIIVFTRAWNWIILEPHVTKKHGHAILFKVFFNIILPSTLKPSSGVSVSVSDQCFVCISHLS